MRTAKVLALCAVAALAACHKESATEVPPVQAAAPVAARKGPGAEQLTAGMVEAPSQGKSQLPVKLKFALEQRPSVGQALEITVALLPQIDAGSASIEVAGEALNVAPPMNRIDLPAVEAGQVYRQSIQVTPTVAGVLLLNLNVSLKHDETSESRVFSIPLIVER